MKSICLILLVATLVSCKSNCKRSHCVAWTATAVMAGKVPVPFVSCSQTVCDEYYPDAGDGE